MKRKEPKFDTIIAPEIELSKQPSNEAAVQMLKRRPSRMNFTFSYEHIEKIKDYAYWEGLTQQQVVAEAMAHFFKDKSIKSRPESLKNRRRPGPKLKNI